MLAQVFELRPHFEWRGLGFIAQSASRSPRAYADFDAELRYGVAGGAGGRPEGVPVRRGAQGCAQTRAVQGLRHGLHPGTPGWGR